MSDSRGTILVSIPPSELKTHALLIGATGSGKTNLLHHLIAQDIACGHSLVVLDLRGDLVSAALELCANASTPNSSRSSICARRFGRLASIRSPARAKPYLRALGVLQAVATEAE